MGSFQVDINTLAPIIFEKNVNNLPIQLDLLHSLNIVSSKDMFYFCMDLLFKGLFIMNPKDYLNKLCINKLSLEDIYATVSKLKLARIETIIIIKQPFIEQSYAHRVTHDSMKLIEEMNDNEHISRYEFNIVIDEVIYGLTFKLSNQA
jgi:hypothetical protein